MAVHTCWPTRCRRVQHNSIRLLTGTSIGNILLMDQIEVVCPEPEGTGVDMVGLVGQFGRRDGTMPDDTVVIQRQVVLFEQVGDQLGGREILCSIVPLPTSSSIACMFYTDGMLIIPVVTGMISNVLFVEHLIDGAIAIDD